jgi:hypothetical protein
VCVIGKNKFLKIYIKNDNIDPCFFRSSPQGRNGSLKNGAKLKFLIAGSGSSFKMVAAKGKKMFQFEFLDKFEEQGSIL